MIRADGKVLFVLLDAFRHDYINPVDTPFLYSGTQRGVYAKRLKSTSGFTQRAAIFTGSMGSETGMFTMYTFDPEASPFRFLENDRRGKRMTMARDLVDKIPAVSGLKRVKRLLFESRDQQEQGYRRSIQKEAKKYASHAPPAYIPLTLLPFIGVSEDNRPIHLPRAFAEESIFDVFVKEQISYEYLMFPAFNCEDEAVMELILGAGQSSARVVLGQFSDSDLMVHHCGPTSQKRRAIAGEIDRRLRDLALHYEEDVTWVIIGDHGMTDVTEELDVSAELVGLEKEAEIRRGVDYLVFLDSTMARFRWLTQRGKIFLTQIAQAAIFNSKGTFIDEHMARQYHIPFSDRRYGDLIWWANLGVLIFPDYFHDRYTHNKGMHGYDSEHDDMKGFFLALGPGISARSIEECHLIDVCASICTAVGVRPPERNQGRSLLAF